jgi:diaminopimelate epimerase
MTPFLKMHGLGNDFAVFDARKQTLTLTRATARLVADRRVGIGCDQIVVIGEGRGGTDAVMRILNADGGEVETCGNAARCVAKLLMAESGKRAIALHTLGGVLRCFAAEGGLYAVDMGVPVVAWEKIPLSCPVDTNRFTLKLGEGTLDAAAVSMGNPHCVLFVPDAETADVAGLGPRIETHPMFPKRTNVEFASMLGENRLRMRVWERGTGITRACGSGASATAFAAFRRGLAGDRIEVVLDGGTLLLETKDGRVRMTGPAALVYAGEIDLAEFAA